MTKHIVHTSPAPGVHHFNTDPFCWYLHEESGKLTLIDAGFPRHYHVLVEGLKLIHKSVADIEAIVLTHAHADHIGFASRVHRESGAPIYIHEVEMNKARKALQLPWIGLVSNAWRSFGREILIKGTLNGVFSCATVSVMKPIADGDTLDIPGSLRVIHTPGHTPGHIMLHNPESGVLFAGDAAVTMNLKTGKSQYPQIPSRSLNMDHERTQQSLCRFADLGFITLLPGHGDPWKGLAQSVANPD
ncbi:MAG: MBL fold metallo-hydrolase [Phycisphaerales bacterium]